MSTPNQIPFKHGDTVMLGCQAFDDTGAPADLTLITVEAQVRAEKDSIAKVADLVVEWVDRAAGSFDLWAPGDGRATGWPLGNLRVDVQYSQTIGARQIVRSTETFFFLIERDVTA